LSQFGEEAKAEFDKIGEDALKGLDEAGARVWLLQLLLISSSYSLFDSIFQIKFMFSKVTFSARNNIVYLVFMIIQCYFFLVYILENS